MSFRQLAEKQRLFVHEEDFHDKWRALLDRWVRSDPNGAMKYLEAISSEPYAPGLIGYAYGAWLGIDRDAAIAYGKAAIGPASKRNEWYLERLLTAIAERDGISEMYTYLGDIPRDESVQNHVVPAVRSLLYENLGQAGEMIAKLPYDNGKPTLYITLGSILGSRFGWEALGSLKPDSPYYAEQLNGMLSAISARDPQGVAAWLNTQPATPDLDGVRARWRSKR